MLTAAVADVTGALSGCFRCRRTGALLRSGVKTPRHATFEDHSILPGAPIARPGAIRGMKVRGSRLRHVLSHRLDPEQPFISHQIHWPARNPSVGDQEAQRRS